MLARVEAVNAQGNELVLPLDDEALGFFVDEIEGLDPVKATLVSSSFAQADGEQHHTSRREKRNMKIKIDLEPDYENYTVRDLRNQLYAFFMPKSELLLRFRMDDGGAYEIRGHVEDFDSPLFVPDPAVDITILCFDPDFIDPNPRKISGVSTAVSDSYLPINYYGTVETGFVFTLHVDQNVSGFYINNQTATGKLQSFEFTEALYAGDKVQISTISGNKYAILTRNGATQSILRAVHPTSAWLELFHGENRFRVSTNNVSMPFDIEFITRYGGL